MQQMKTQLQKAASGFGRARSAVRNGCIAVAGFGVANAYAIDTLGVTAAIDAAEADALTVGEAVIAAVAALVVVGIIIAVVKKI